MSARILLAIVCMVFLCHCRNAPTDAGTPHAQKPKDTTVFYPINSYIREQLTSLNQATTTPYQIVENENGKNDSSAISKENIQAYAHRLLLDSINAPGLQEKYTENIFLDQSTASFTFSYTTIDTSLPVQSVLVLLDTTTQEVKDIIYTINRTYPDSAVLEKWWWKNNKGFTILKSVVFPDGQEKKQQIKVVW